MAVPAMFHVVIIKHFMERHLTFAPSRSVLERFVVRCRGAGLVTDELVRKMPSRGRKRFVSEGDGGRIKENWW